MHLTDAEAVAARVTPRSAGHAAFALTSFLFADLVRRGAIPAQDARLLVSRAAVWADRDDPAAASLLDALTGRLARS